ncbi:10934_t:CDS:2, partial [Racocetra persica]
VQNVVHMKINEMSDFEFDFEESSTFNDGFSDEDDDIEVENISFNQNFIISTLPFMNRDDNVDWSEIETENLSYEEEQTSQ